MKTIIIVLALVSSVAACGRIRINTRASFTLVTSGTVISPTHTSGSIAIK